MIPRTRKPVAEAVESHPPQQNQQRYEQRRHVFGNKEPLIGPGSIRWHDHPPAPWRNNLAMCVPRQHFTSRDDVVVFVTGAHHETVSFMRIVAMLYLQHARESVARRNKAFVELRIAGNVLFGETSERGHQDPYARLEDVRGFWIVVKSTFDDNAAVTAVGEQPQQRSADRLFETEYCGDREGKRDAQIRDVLERTLSGGAGARNQ